MQSRIGFLEARSVKYTVFELALFCAYGFFQDLACCHRCWIYVARFGGAAKAHQLLKKNKESQALHCSDHIVTSGG